MVGLWGDGGQERALADSNRRTLGLLLCGVVLDAQSRFMCLVFSLSFLVRVGRGRPLVVIRFRYRHLGKVVYEADKGMMGVCGNEPQVLLQNAHVGVMSAAEKAPPRGLPAPISAPSRRMVNSALP